MVPEKYRLAAVGRFLLEQFELRRPGIREWSPRAEASLRQEAESELQLMEKQLRELGMEDLHYWQRVRRALDEMTHRVPFRDKLRAEHSRRPSTRVAPRCVVIC